MLKGEQIKLEQVNIGNKAKDKPKIIDQVYFKDLQCHPRPNRPAFIFEDDLPPEPEWKFEESIFYGYIPDSDELLKKCFEYDWSNGKIPKIIKNQEELNKIKEYLCSVYKEIRENYKYCAGISPCTYIPCIGQNAFNEIINLTSIIDSKDCKLSDIDFEFIATNSSTKRQTLNPERWLVRYQFMEIFVRIALHKYFKQQANVDIDIRLSESDVVRKIFEEQLLGNFKKHNAHRWREQKLWNKECDYALKPQASNLKKLFNMYSGKYTKPGKPVFVSIDEFMCMISISGILGGGSIGPGEIGALFNVSMMTQVKELESERHTNMFWLEFIEAISRVADALDEFPSNYVTNSSKDSSTSLVQTQSKLSLTYFIHIENKMNADLDISKISGKDGKQENEKADKPFTFKSITHLELHEKIALFVKLLVDTSLKNTK